MHVREEEEDEERRNQLPLVHRECLPDPQNVPESVAASGNFKGRRATSFLKISEALQAPERGRVLRRLMVEVSHGYPAPGDLSPTSYIEREREIYLLPPPTPPLQGTLGPRSARKCSPRNVGGRRPSGLTDLHCVCVCLEY